MSRRIIAVAVVALLCAACQVKEDRSSRISEIVHQREQLDGKRVLVRGYIEVDVLDRANFVEEKGPPVGERITGSIDLVPHDEHVRRKVAELDGACIVVDGVFHAYGPHRVPVSGLVSLYGAVDAREVRRCE
jgi:hypothetical protein